MSGPAPRGARCRTRWRLATGGGSAPWEERATRTSPGGTDLAVCEGELLEADGELDVAGPHYVLDLELSKLGLPPATPRSGAALRVPRDFFIRAGNWYHAPQKRPSRWLQFPPGLPFLQMETPARNSLPCAIARLSVFNRPESQSFE